MSKMYVTADEVAEILRVSRGYKYKVIRKLNEELKKKGYTVVSGKVSVECNEEKFYGISVTARLKHKCIFRQYATFTVKEYASP